MSVITNTADTDESPVFSLNHLNSMALEGFFSHSDGVPSIYQRISSFFSKPINFKEHHHLIKVIS